MKKHTATRRRGLRAPRGVSRIQLIRHYALLAAVVVVGVAAHFSVSFVGVRASVLTYATNTTISGLLTYTNQERQSRGIAPLSLNSALNSAAAAKAQDMVARDYWSHETPDGQQPWVFVDAAGYAYMAVGENLAYGFPDSSSTVTAWMNSPGHRDNMLNTIYDEVGFATANSENYVGNGNQTVVVAFYGTLGAQETAPVAAPSEPSAPPPASTPQAVENTVTQNHSSPAQQPTEPATPEVEQETVTPVVTQDQEADSEAKDDASLSVVGTPSVTENVPERHISLFQVMLGDYATWIAVLSAVAFAGAGLWFFVRHSVAAHRVFILGEQFVLHHKKFDVVLVAAVMVVTSLLQTIGVIQ